MTDGEIVQEQLNSKRRNSSLEKGLRFTETGVIQASDEIINQFQLGKNNGLDFVYRENGIGIAIVPIDKKPTLFGSKKMLQGREKDQDGKIRIVEKDQIDGRQIKPEIFYNFTQTEDISHVDLSNAKSFDIELHSLIDNNEDSFVLFKKGKKAINRKGEDIYDFKITNIIQKKSTSDDLPV